MRAAVQQPRWVWRLQPGIPNCEVVAAGDPRIPPDPPIAGPAARLTGRDAPLALAGAAMVPVRRGTLYTWRAWWRHDPACPAGTHAALRALAHRYIAAGSSWYELGRTTAAGGATWQLVQWAWLDTTPDGISGQVHPSIDQANGGPCTWWILGGQGIILG